MTTLSLKLTVEQAVAIESALRSAVFNARDAERTARQLNLATCAEHCRQDIARTEAIIEDFNYAFSVALSSHNLETL